MVEAELPSSLSSVDNVTVIQISMGYRPLLYGPIRL